MSPSKTLMGRVHLQPHISARSWDQVACGTELASEHMMGAGTATCCAVSSDLQSGQGLTYVVLMT